MNGKTIRAGQNAPVATQKDRLDSFKKIEARLCERRDRELGSLQKLREDYVGLMGAENPEISARIHDAEARYASVLARLTLKHQHFVRLMGTSDSKNNLDAMGPAANETAEAQLLLQELGISARELVLARSMDEERYVALRFAELRESVPAEPIATYDTVPAGMAIVRAEEQRIVPVFHAAIAMKKLAKTYAAHIGQTLGMRGDEVRDLISDYPIGAVTAMVESAELNGIRLNRLVSVHMALNEDGNVGAEDLRDAVAVCNAQSEISLALLSVIYRKEYAAKLREYERMVAEVYGRIGEPTIEEMAGGEVALSEYRARRDAALKEIGQPVERKTGDGTAVSLRFMIDIFELFGRDRDQFYDFVEYFKTEFSSAYLKTQPWNVSDEFGTTRQLAEFHGLSHAKAGILDRHIRRKARVHSGERQKSGYSPALSKMQSTALEVLRDYIRENERIYLDVESKLYHAVKRAHEEILEESGYSSDMERFLNKALG